MCMRQQRLFDVVQLNTWNELFLSTFNHHDFEAQQFTMLNVPHVTILYLLAATTNHA